MFFLGIFFEIKPSSPENLEFYVNLPQELRSEIDYVSGFLSDDANCYQMNEAKSELLTVSCMNHCISTD